MDLSEGFPDVVKRLRRLRKRSQGDQGRSKKDRGESGGRRKRGEDEEIDDNHKISRRFLRGSIGLLRFFLKDFEGGRSEEVLREGMSEIFKDKKNQSQTPTPPRQLLPRYYQGLEVFG